MHVQKFDEMKLTGALPSPTGVGLRILELTRDDDFSMAEITRAIEADPALSARILRIANSAENATLVGARTVSDATLRLGVGVVRSVALGFSLVSSSLHGPCRTFDYQAYWSFALGSAVAAKVLSLKYPSLVPAEAFTAALLSGIGRLALASVHPERYADVLVEARMRGAELLTQLETQAFDLHHAELGAALLLDWRLPEDYARAVAQFEEYDPSGVEELRAAELTEVLWGGAAIASVCLCVEGASNEWRSGGDDDLELLRERLGLSPEAFFAMCDGILYEWREWGEVLQVPTQDVPSFELMVRQARDRRDERVFHEEEPAPPDGKALNILVVDDDRAAQRILVAHLQREGHLVVTAGNGREALALALERAPHLILTDWVMPEMTGVELCRALRRTEAGRKMFILVLTGQDQEDHVVEAFDAGADDYVVKPFNPKILLARVRAGQRLIELREKVERDKKNRTKQVAQMAILNRKLRSAALTDPLTGLPNRRFATRCLEQETSHAHRMELPLSVVMIDIDHFKDVNDQHGHDVGDTVLRETAAVLRRTARKSDVVCRLGGEEFLVVCRGSDLSSAAQTAERLRAAVEDNRIVYAGFDGNVTVSLGVAELEHTNGTVDGLLRAADELVYRAKGLGRNLVCDARPPGAGPPGADQLSA